jgi:ParB-like chromosome segregation protein Spo0J
MKPLKETRIGPESSPLRSIPDRIELFAIERLIPSARNARTHSEQQIAELAGSMRAFGFMVPVLVDAEGGIIAGHARVLAARKLNLDRVPVIVIQHLTETEKRAYAIADNKIALNAGWDEELLRVELESLKDDGVDLDDLGFSEAEFNELLDKLSPESTQGEDVAPEAPSTPVSQRGDLWQLGDHRLFCGDATDAASYLAVLAGEPAGMVFSDPPYNVAYHAPGLGVGISNDVRPSRYERR